MMVDASAVQLLAELPPSGLYFDPVKVTVFAAAMFLWWYTWAWVDKDAVRVRSQPLPWTSMIGAASILGTAMWLFLPSWGAGLAVFLVAYGGATLAYALFRNKRVSPAQTILTINHLMRLFGGSGKAKTRDDSAKDKVRIKGADGKPPAWPTDPVQHDGYSALQDLLFDALWRRASDVDVTLAGQQARIFYKVDGVVRERDPLDRPQADVALAHLKRIGGMDPEELRRPQEGRLTAIIGAGGSGDKKVDLLIKSFGSTTSHRVQMRLLAEESKYRISDLGFTKPQLEILEPIVNQNQGLLLCCGPKESGVTSLLYAMLRAHDAFMWNVHTMETSKLMDIENITQHVYDAKDAAYGFARQLQSVFRTDPDIVMIGECAERDTAVLCTEFAQNKKVYLAMSASDATDGLRKLLEYVGDNPLVARVLKVVIAGRLVRKLCTHCRKGYRPDANLLKKANLPLDQNRPFYRPPNTSEIEVDRRGNPVVCQVCQGAGYLGRTGIYEVMLIDDALRKMIEEGASLQNIKAHARKSQMQYLQEAGLQKVFEGITSITEVSRVTREEKAGA